MCKQDYNNIKIKFPIPTLMYYLLLSYLSILIVSDWFRLEILP